ncbi:hypothetical protein Y1Q_0021843 [Alligator mississippiensis]|uniref:Uncharacterized protein n=1 Tax=Alligator mississippiensis TaxID=8496 RepID=A0A151PBM2_ALLMI|nr:hypothetical protein Y1Q_0021843 [Alligator mississippiensis]
MSWAKAIKLKEAPPALSGAAQCGRSRSRSWRVLQALSKGDERFEEISAEVQAQSLLNPFARRDHKPQLCSQDHT